ncbi:MAG: hypothetical protein NTX03_14815 [Bacteroidetes bacterium]|nr:hypothetical protein [Bacteroidota bacterium]
MLLAGTYAEFVSTYAEAVSAYARQKSSAQESVSTFLKQGSTYGGLVSTAQFQKHSTPNPLKGALTFNIFAMASERKSPLGDLGVWSLNMKPLTLNLIKTNYE